MRLAALAAAVLTLAAAPAAQLSQTTLRAPDGRPDDSLGEAVDMDGNRLVVGVRLWDVVRAPGDTLFNTGAVYTWERADGAWTMTQKLLAPEPTEREFFGETVLTHGDWLFVGAMGHVPPGRSVPQGAVYAYRWDDGAWAFAERITPIDARDFHGFGWELAFDGDSLFISAPQDDDLRVQAGAVYRFAFEDGRWRQREKLLPTSADPADVSFFGTAMGLDGDVLLVGSPTDSEADVRAGAAYVFERDGDRWTQRQKLLPPPVAPPDSLDEDTFGRELALEGDWALVTSFDDEVCIRNGDLRFPDEPNQCSSGAAFAYRRQASGEWGFEQKIAPDELEQFDTFGLLGVDIEGGVAAFGTRGDDDACPVPGPPDPLLCDTGAVYLHELRAGTWEPLAKLTAADADSLDFLGGVWIGQGRPVALSGGFVVAGAPTIPSFEGKNDTRGKVVVFKVANGDPVAADDDALVQTGTATTIDVLANDADPDFDALAIEIVRDPDHGTVAVADGAVVYTSDAGYLGADLFRYRIVDEDGGSDRAEVTLTVASEVADEPDAGPRLALELPRPNPFADATELRFTLPAPGPVRLAVYDALGRELAVLVDGERPAGDHAVTFDAGGPSGVLVVRLEAGGKALSRTVLRVR